MKQLMVIHGGDAFATYEEYIEFLKGFPIEYNTSLRGKGWKANLPEVLGAGYEVIAPRMPNPTNAKYLEWKIWFEKYIPYIEDGVIFVGHSFGGSFIAKYLSEEIFPKRIDATFLVAAPYDTDGERKVVEFVLPESLALLEKQAGTIYLYQSADDDVVPFQEVHKYEKALTGAIVRIFNDRQHFNQEYLPEIIEDIKNLR